VESVLITGASGFIGGHLSEKMAEKGYRLRLQYRRDTPPRWLKKLGERGAELMQLDLTQPGAPERAVRGMEGIIHAAAFTWDWASRETIAAINTEVPKYLLQAARTEGCRQFLLISSLVVHGFGPHRSTTEEGPYFKPVNLYQETKYAAEQYVLHNHSSALKTAAVRPGNVYGPGDTTTFYRIFDAMMKGIMAYTGRGDKLTSPVYIDDLTEAVISAYENEAAGGEVFNITTEEEVTWKDILDYCASLLGVKPPSLHVPVFLARLVAWKLEGIYSALHIKTAPPVTRYRVESVSNDYYFNNEKARNLLGFSPSVGWREGFTKTVEAYLKTGRPY
jgi:nucleoside-diphosphate-sugar epimerase